MSLRAHPVDWDDFRIADVPSHPEPFRLINRIPIRDNGERLVDLRVTNPDLSFGAPCLPYVREGVAEALKTATGNTPDHLELRVHSALRRLEDQAEMYWGNYKRAKEEHPNWPESVVRRMTNRFFAPPDAKAPPGHCTGGAVDISLILRGTGEVLDVRSPIEGWKAAPTAVEGLSPEAAGNRRLLCYIMYSTGLSNCRDEYWHWSYGDSAWAVRTGAKTAVYGLIEPPTGATRVTGPKIELKPYDPAWVGQFEELGLLLEAKIGAHLVGIEHVGSTSVPGLAAKPFLDIDLMVADELRMAALIAGLQELGYEHRGDQGIEGREVFRRSSDEGPAHHLYAGIQGARALKRHVAFRDYLRAHPEAAAEYGELKARLAKEFPWDRIRYNDAKEPFVLGVLSKADPSLV